MSVENFFRSMLTNRLVKDVSEFEFQNFFNHGVIVVLSVCYSKISGPAPRL